MLRRSGSCEMVDVVRRSSGMMAFSKGSNNFAAGVVSG